MRVVVDPRRAGAERSGAERGETGVNDREGMVIHTRDAPTRRTHAREKKDLSPKKPHNPTETSRSENTKKTLPRSTKTPSAAFWVHP